MSIKTKTKGADEIRTAIEVLKSNIVDNEILEKVAKEVSKSLIERTEKGRDSHGRMFKPYSKPYAARRRKKGLRTSHVNLKDTGEMLEGITFKADLAQGRALVYFKDSESDKKAAYHNRAGVGRVVRKFFALSEADKTMVNSLVVKHVKKVIGNAL